MKFEVQIDRDIIEKFLDLLETLQDNVRFFNEKDADEILKIINQIKDQNGRTNQTT